MKPFICVCNCGYWLAPSLWYNIVLGLCNSLIIIEHFAQNTVHAVAIRMKTIFFFYYIWDANILLSLNKDKAGPIGCVALELPGVTVFYEWTDFPHKVFLGREVLLAQGQQPVRLPTPAEGRSMCSIGPLPRRDITQPRSHRRYCGSTVCLPNLCLHWMESTLPLIRKLINE